MVRGVARTDMFSTALKGRHEKNTITGILIGRPLTGKALVSKNSNKHINGSPLSPDVSGQGCASRTCYCVVIVAEHVFKY